MNENLNISKTSYNIQKKQKENEALNNSVDEISNHDVSELGSIYHSYVLANDINNQMRKVLFINKSLFPECEFSGKAIVCELWKEVCNHFHLERLRSNGLPLRNNGLGIHIKKFRNKMVNMYLLNSQPGLKTVKVLSKKLEKWCKLRNNFFKYKEKYRSPSTGHRLNMIAISMENKNNEHNYSLNVDKSYVSELRSISSGIHSTLKDCDVEHDYCRSSPNSSASLNNSFRSMVTNIGYRILPSEIELDHDYSLKLDENVEIELCDLCLELETLAIDTSPSLLIQAQNLCNGGLINEVPESTWSNCEYILHFETQASDEKHFLWQNYNNIVLPSFRSEEQRCQCSSCHENLMQIQQNWGPLTLSSNNETQFASEEELVNVYSSPCSQIIKYSVCDDSESTVEIILENIDVNGIENSIYISKVQDKDVADKRTASDVPSHRIPLKKRKTRITHRNY